jgi:hypothetical protein
VYSDQDGYLGPAPSTLTRTWPHQLTAFYEDSSGQFAYDTVNVEVANVPPSILVAEAPSTMLVGVPAEFRVEPHDINGLGYHALCGSTIWSMAAGESTGGESGESSSGGGSGGYDSGERPVPGAQCVAPCVWAVIEPCRASRSCTYSRNGGVHECYDNGVSILVSMEGVQAYMPDGSPCYSVEFPENGVETWKDGEGSVVAVSTKVNNFGDRVVTCGGDEYAVNDATPGCQESLDLAPCVEGDCVAGP